MEDDPIDPRFVPGNILKRDVFSETIEGHLKYDEATKLVCRSLKNVPLWHGLLRDIWRNVKSGRYGEFRGSRERRLS